MSAAPAGIDPAGFSRSSRTALAWATHRAAHRAGGPQAEAPAAAEKNVLSSAGRGATAAGDVTAPDLLVGILLAHPGDSEPILLLRHAGVPGERLLRLLEPTGFTAPPGTGDPPAWDGSVPLDAEAEGALRRAMELGATVNPEPGGLVRLRDLFGGLLEASSEVPSLLAMALDDAPLVLSDVISVYPRFLALETGASRFDGFLRAWLPVKGAEGVEGVDTQGPETAEAGAETGTRVREEPEADALRTTAGMRVAVVDGDRPDTEDLVGIGDEVDALAYLMASPALHPPLAVGLFGDWGSGKSFFMEALRRRIEVLTAAARASERPQGELAVFRNVAQIEFNAWHYVDGNLWASLVEHIFHTLAGGEGPDDPTGLEERMRDWTTELETQQVARAEVNRRLALLHREQTERAEELERSRRKRRKKLEALQETRTRDALQTLTLAPEVKGPIEDLLADVGFDSLRSSAAETKEALEDARAILRQGNALLTPLRRRGWEGWRWASVLVLIILSGPAVAWALTALPEVPLDGVTRTFTGIAAFLSFATVALRRGSGWLAGSLRRVEAAQARLEELRARRAAELALEEAQLQHELDLLDEEVTRLADRKAELDERIDTIRAELENLTPTRLLSEFIDERVGSDDYRKHLGVPALVRRDFRRLSSLIKAQNEALLLGGAPPTDAAPVVNRVVLYIDDLDRCPPDRVVAVLQAVHLLLAFDLFVVVVAVDSRWLSRSLLSHYRSLLGGLGADGTGGPVHDQATPDDYLEKIFQIPFHVRPLNGDAQRRILQGLLEPGGGGAANGGPSEEGARARTDAGDGRSGRDRTPGATWDEAGEAGKGGVEAAGREGGALSAQRNVASEGDGAAAHPGQFPAVSLDPPDPPDLTPERMRVRQGELDFMEDLRPLLGRTPRSVKRFVNVYRLLTAIAEAREEGFYREDEDISPYRIAMFLLAVVTGLPGLSSDILRFVVAGAGALQRGETTREELTLGWTLTRYSQGGLVLRPEGPSPEYRRLKAWLDTYEDGRWKDLPLDRIAPWVDLVSRFSFRSEVGIGG